MAFDLSTAKKIGGEEEKPTQQAEMKPSPPEADPSQPYRISPRLRINRDRKDGGTMDAMADAAMNAGYNVGGAATDVVSKVLPPEVAAAAGTAANLGIEGAMMAGGSLAKAPGAAKWLMQSALKPGAAAQATGKAARAVDTLLKEGVSVSQEGVAKMRSLINGLEEQVAQIVKDSKGVLSTDAVMERLLPVYERFLAQPAWKADAEAIAKVARETRSNPMVGKDMTVQAAQEMKEGAYRALGDKAYGMGLKPAAERDAQKAVARGLKEEIEGVAPKVKGLNARESELINALKLTGHRVGMEANKNPFGLGWTIHDPISPQMMAWMIDRSGAAKSALANALYNGRLGQIGASPLAAQVGMEPGRTLADFFNDQ